MPSPMETLLRTQDSPVPTQTFLGLPGSMATAPMDCTDGLSKTGLKLVPALTDFQTPPLAEAAKTGRRGPSLTAATAASRPLLCAEPILRACSQEMVPASKRTGACAKSAGATRRSAKRRAFMLELLGGGRHLELGGIQRHVGLDFVEGDFGPLRALLPAHLDGERHVYARHLLVRPALDYRFLDRAADG